MDINYIIGEFVKGLVLVIGILLKDWLKEKHDKQKRRQNSNNSNRQSKQKLTRSVKRKGSRTTLWS